MALFFLIPLLFFIGLQFFVTPHLKMSQLSYSEFYDMVSRNSTSSEIDTAELVGNVVRGRLRSGDYYQVTIPMTDLELIPLLRQNVNDFQVVQDQSFWKNVIYSVLPVLLLIGFFWFFVYRGVSQSGGKIFTFGKSKARLFDEKDRRITFQDVAGVQEAKEELEEIIAFLKDPKKFQRLGGRIPKGVLLMGPPGTGKTLLARAVAGEANVPFFSISGSDFVEMFVGVGAARVRDLFEQGKRASKTSGRGAIIFIDEIDAVGRQRFAGIGGGHDEREQTLNALLVEMDGFDTQTGVIMIGSTNRPDVLDPALLRPGRFDRTIVIDRPDMIGREAILKVHTKDKKLAPDVNLNKLARQTPGFSGADLANLVNEGALLAARRDKEWVTQRELEESIERVMAGPERKSRLISKNEKKTVAVHESGHALLTLLVTQDSDQLHKVSIIPRGQAALGYTLHLPLEDRYLATEKQLLDKITVLFGGRAAEELVFNEITTGAHNDIEIATNYAQRMVMEYGMSKKLGNLTFGKKDREVFLGRDLMREKDYSEQTAITIDQEVQRIVNECYGKAKRILQENIEKLKKLADALLEKEVLDQSEVRQLLGFGPAPSQST
ncbi:MAG: cell division protein FtsH [Candidatus Omnitrophica bacterium CG11_big_fil_rev_8_21_14_0_20_45_26]|uniref:ATP-dependent zinc metalloprotease FtsH n=1 Tax=Candidatus Abzuiibacterium crystallinum TaxID=1974748 RepID=A0A2H0LKN5_9BACT|nr:MAG: cell division protein FtsH [Candidatus Omnitrophica bacterium CG11_big_fil_rev_8_21_14_0_20_45_26]PIW63944.1 MAG: cell division protein FtsH [Candidatus Omnitrophica bacterium CG12_big_fil_rev_8_21_14_0_65_45_16]